MGTRRYGIFLRVEHKRRNFISTSSHVIFCLSYQHSSPNWHHHHLYLLYFSSTKIDLQHYQLESGRWESHLTYNNKSSKEKVL